MRTHPLGLQGVWAWPGTCVERDIVCTHSGQLPHSLSLLIGACEDLCLCPPFPARLVQDNSLIKNSVGREVQYKQHILFFTPPTSAFKRKYKSSIFIEEDFCLV